MDSEKQLTHEELYAPHYLERKNSHKDIRDTLRKKGQPESWPVRTGTYNNGLNDEPVEPITVNGVELEGMEAIIYKQINEVLTAKTKDRIDSPVIALDLGGMYGIGSIKLAKAMEDLVRSGRVVFVVSNLTFNPGTMSKEDVKSFSGLNHSQYDDFFLQNRELINFVMSDVEELKSIQLSLPNGKTQPLFGYVDLIHEQNALGKSHLPDSDLPLLGRSLSSYGTFLLGDYDPKYSVEPKAFELGESNLMRTGVHQINIGEKANYKVFAKPKSPLIATNPRIQLKK